MKTPHKHAEIIHAYANGAEIEYRVKDAQRGWSGWKPFKDVGRFLTDPWWEYRIKQEPKPDVVSYLIKVDRRTTLVSEWTEATDWSVTLKVLEEIKIIRDGETGKLKSAEVL